MTKCPECGLPVSACNALNLYRRAVRAVGSGKLDEAAHYAEAADEEYARFVASAASNPIIRPHRLKMAVTDSKAKRSS